MKLGEFSIHYDGESVANHEIDVTTLAPGLLAISEMTQAAYKVTAPLDNRKPSVKIQAVKPGSFEVVLNIDLSFIEGAISMFTSRYTTALVNSAAVYSLIASAVKALKNRINKDKPTSEEELFNELLEELKNDKQLAQHVYKLIHDRRFKNATRKLVEPLSNESGIEELQIRGDDGNPMVTINRDEAQRMMLETQENQPTIRLEEATIEISTLHMHKATRKKWGILHPDYGSVNARMLDADFANQTMYGETTFRGGQKFKVTLRVEEVIDEDSGDIIRSFEILKMLPIDEGKQLELGEEK